MTENLIKTKGFVGDWKIVDTIIVMNRTLYVLKHSTIDEAPMMCIDEFENVVINNIRDLYSYCSPRQINIKINDKKEILQ